MDMFVQTCSWTKQQIINISVEYSCWPGVICVYQKGPKQIWTCQILLTSQNCPAFTLFFYTPLLFPRQSIRSLKNKSVDIMVSFKLSFPFCELFLIKVGLHISDLYMSIFWIKLFGIYLQGRWFSLIQWEGKRSLANLLIMPLKTVFLTEYNSEWSLSSFSKDHLLMIISNKNLFGSHRNK